MNSASKHQRLEIVIRVIIAIAFCVGVARWDNSLKKKDWEEIRKHSEVIENDLWNLDSDGPANYLQLATRLNNYEQLTVYSSNDEIFIKIEGAEANLLDQFLIKVGLIPKIQLQADISHEDIIIGRIEAIHRHDNIYTYLYSFVVILLGLLSLGFFIRIHQAKATLELRIRERTEELAEEKERLAVTLRSIGDGVITTDLEGKIVLINKITEQLTGWSLRETVGRPIQEVFNVINVQTGKSCENLAEKVLATGEIITLVNDTALIARDGTQYLIEDSGAPIFDKESKVIGTVLVFRDVTEERKIMEELFKVKKLESVGVLAGGIAHDFNNILAAILGNIELAEIYTDPANQAYPLLEEAKKASIRAKSLTQQLLTFSKGGDPVKQTTSIATIITDSANFVLHGSSVVCDYNIPEDLWHVDVDTGQISQVIQNIIINARHAMPEGGLIEVCCANITDGTEEALSLSIQKYIKITIADSGTGIPAKFIGKIFDPYFSTKQEGSGLGLAICYSIISKHDGNISVQSEANIGTIFTIYLPASTNSTQETAPVEHGLITVEDKATIMIMDDESMIRDITKQMLTQSGHEVLLAENGHEAIEIYNEYFKNKQSIDIIIMDLTIPGGMGGKDTVQEILRINPEAKVVVASGYSNDPVMAHYQEHGFKASIAKPFQHAELNKLISDIMQ